MKDQKYRLVAVALFVAVITGCTPSRSAPAIIEPPLGEVTTVVSRSQVAPAPLLQYKTTMDEQFDIQNAVARLSAECMARFGVVASPVQSRREDIAAARAGAADRYGPVSLDEAAIAVSPRPPEQNKGSAGVAADPREGELLSGLDATGQPSKLRDRAGNSVPQYGCGREGFNKLGYRPDDIILVDGLLNQSWSLLGQDSRYRAVEEEWSACMKERGFNLKGRGDSSADPGELQARVKPDVECAQAVNYVGIVNALDVAHQNQLIRQNNATLTGVRENNKSMAAKAQEVLGG